MFGDSLVSVYERSEVITEPELVVIFRNSIDHISIVVTTLVLEDAY